MHQTIDKLSKGALCDSTSSMHKAMVGHGKWHAKRCQEQHDIVVRSW